MNEPEVQTDNNNCIKCKNCIQAYLAEIIISAENNAGVKDQNLKYCISCKGCIAVCPEEAITHQDAETKEINRERKQDFTSEQFLNFLQKRRTIRSYKKGNLSKTY